MKRTITASSQSVTLRLVTDTESESEPVYSHFGPVNQGLITTRKTENQRLEELLSYLEKQVAILVSRSYEVLDTCKLDTEAPRVEHSPFITEGDGIR